MAKVSLISRTAGLTNTNEKIDDRLPAKAPGGAAVAQCYGLRDKQNRK